MTRQQEASLLPTFKRPTQQPPHGLFARSKASLPRSSNKQKPQDEEQGLCPTLPHINQSRSPPRPRYYLPISNDREPQEHPQQQNSYQHQYAPAYNTLPSDSHPSKRARLALTASKHPQSRSYNADRYLPLQDTPRESGLAQVAGPQPEKHTFGLSPGQYSLHQPRPRGTHPYLPLQNSPQEYRLAPIVSQQRTSLQSPLPPINPQAYTLAPIGHRSRGHTLSSIIAEAYPRAPIASQQPEERTSLQSPLPPISYDDHRLVSIDHSARHSLSSNIGGVYNRTSIGSQNSQGSAFNQHALPPVPAEVYTLAPIQQPEERTSIQAPLPPVPADAYTLAPIDRSPRHSLAGVYNRASQNPQSGIFNQHALPPVPAEVYTLAPINPNQQPQPQGQTLPSITSQLYGLAPIDRRPRHSLSSIIARAYPRAPINSTQQQQARGYILPPVLAAAYTLAPLNPAHQQQQQPQGPILPIEEPNTPSTPSEAAESSTQDPPAPFDSTLPPTVCIYAPKAISKIPSQSQLGKRDLAPVLSRLLHESEEDDLAWKLYGPWSGQWRERETPGPIAQRAREGVEVRMREEEGERREEEERGRRGRMAIEGMVEIGLPDDEEGMMDAWLRRSGRRRGERGLEILERWMGKWGGQMRGVVGGQRREWEERVGVEYGLGVLRD